MTPWRRLSRDIDLLRIDVSTGEHVAEIRKLPIPVLKDGVAVGIVRWMNVDLADGIAFGSRLRTFRRGRTTRRDGGSRPQQSHRDAAGRPDKRNGFTCGFSRNPAKAAPACDEPRWRSMRMTNPR
jgi:hypothetical protein